MNEVNWSDILPINLEVSVKIDKNADEKKCIKVFMF